ncbi:MAG: hypothetical protein Q8T08_00930, partial [Ignavibacteria bacterium]|nr:hypothetical protein [Ignavibacteria bacterium]
EVVGSWTTQEYLNLAFFFSNGVTANLGSPLEGAYYDKNGCISYANHINEQGQIVGVSTILEPPTDQAFIINSTDSLQASSLINPYPLSVSTSALAINEAAQVVGYGLYEGFYFFPLLFVNGTVFNLENALGSSVDINDVYGPDGIGQIIGYLYDFDESMNDNYYSPYVYINGEMSIFAKELCPQSIQGCQFTAINNKGQIVGINIFENNNPSPATGFLYDLNTQELTQLEFRPYDINDLGWIIGEASQQNGPLFQVNAYLYINGTQYDLLDLLPESSTTNLTQLSPTAINNQGQIVCTAYYGSTNNAPVGVILNPLN